MEENNKCNDCLEIKDGCGEHERCSLCGACPLDGCMCQYIFEE